MRRNVAFEDSMMNSITTAVNKIEQWWTLRTLQQNPKWLWQQHDNGLFKLVQIISNRRCRTSHKLQFQGIQF
jgi:hypothetical protein